MEDQRIIGLFWDRSENAIDELKNKYGGRALAMAANILGTSQDAEECVADALHTLWARIPPERPEHLWAYFSRILRNLCCSRLDYLTAAKRDRGCQVALSELEGVLAAGMDPAEVLESKRITEVLNAFLSTLDRTGRIMFVRRYYYFDSCADIAGRLGMTRGAVNTRLCRLREELRETLEKEEIYV